jgi:3-oxoacyl-[acyl-carrier protein] reductase
MNRTVVITGATGVLGGKVAHAFAQGGHSLALLDNDRRKLDALVRNLNLPEARLFRKVMDLRDVDAVRSAAEAVTAKFDQVHALIHLVGGWTGGKTIPEASMDDFDFMLGQHAWTTFHLLQAFAPRLAESGWGRVIIVSMPVTVEPVAKMGVYAAAKAAQESLVLTLAEEFKEAGVTANVIHVRSIDVKGEGKGTSPDEIVAAMLYLFSEEANRVSGVRFPLY